jgi:hypothetical protein
MTTARVNPGRSRPEPTLHPHPAQHLRAPTPTTLPGPTRPSSALPSSTTRDYAAEMRAVIEAEVGDGPFVSAVVASHIVDKLRATDADLLHGWLDFQAVGILRDAISAWARSTRSHARGARGRSVFADAVDRDATGDETAISRFLDIRYVVDDRDTRVRLADLHKVELLFAADDYRRQANENLLEEAFLRALAKKVGRGKVSDHFSDEQLAAMWRSISGADS